MVFDYSDLNPPEVAMLALEYLRERIRWLEHTASQELGAGEVSRVMSEAANSLSWFTTELEERIVAHYGDSLPRLGIVWPLREGPTAIAPDLAWERC